MTIRQKLELSVNTPTQIELLYDECVSGENQYGAYYLYAVKCNGAEYSFFPSEALHRELQKYRRGDKIKITRLSAFRGSKLVSTYEVKPVEASDAIKEPETGGRDKFYNIMLNSYS